MAVATRRGRSRWGVTFPPEAHRSLVEGVDTITRVLAATLGPVGRTVAVEQARDRNRVPEILTDAGTIARRITELPNRNVNAGAMLIRSMVWDMRDRVGDGSATAAVLARAMIHSGGRMLAAGANPALMRQGIEDGIQAAVAHLDRCAQPLDSPEVITSLVESTTRDKGLSDLIVEIFDIVGPEGAIVVEEYVGMVTEREYVEGVSWDTGLVSSQFMTDPAHQEARVSNPAIAIASCDMTSAEQAASLLHEALQMKAESLVLIAPRVEGQALATLVINRHRLPMLAIRAPGLLRSQPEILRDLAVLTGSIVVDPAAGRSLESFRAEYFGGARRVVADLHRFTVVGGRGGHKEIRGRRDELLAQIARDDPLEQSIQQRRLANLSGGVAILKVGAISETERKLRVQMVEDAIRYVQSGLKEGVVAGGGAAYVECIPEVRALASASTNADHAAGLTALAESLSAPLVQIAENAGYGGRTALESAKMAGPGCGFDVLSGRVVNMRQAGILDPLLVLRLALQKAASVAVMILTVGAFVVPRKPPTPTGRV